MGIITNILLKGNKMIASRELSALHPRVMQMAIEFIKRCKEAGIDVIITSTYRDYESQNALYAQGRTTKGAKVTNAKGGYSMHNFKCAFDFAPLKNGKIDWNDTKLFARCGRIAESIGLEWGGSWTSFVDLPHCQWTNGLTLEQLRNGAKLA
jgi:peptidoglycan LD-endopeptidase CwlK